MYRTIYDKVTGEIQGCINLSDDSLTAYLAQNPIWDAITVYTTGVTGIAVDVLTKKLKKIDTTAPTVAELIRQRRASLLSSSDWTQAVDSPLSDEKKAEWAAYRQALRDLPDDQGGVNSIDDVAWPARPV